MYLIGALLSIADRWGEISLKHALGMGGFMSINLFNAFQFNYALINAEERGGMNLIPTSIPTQSVSFYCYLPDRPRMLAILDIL